MLNIPLQDLPLAITGCMASRLLFERGDQLVRQGKFDHIQMDLWGRIHFIYQIIPAIWIGYESRWWWGVVAYLAAIILAKLYVVVLPSMANLASIVFFVVSACTIGYRMLDHSVEIVALLDSPVPVWVFGSFMLTGLWLLQVHFEYFQDKVRRTFDIMAGTIMIGIIVSQVIGLVCGVIFVSVYFYKFGIWDAVKSLVFASVVSVVSRIVLEQVVTREVMVFVSFLMWPLSAYVIGVSLFR